MHTNQESGRAHHAHRAALLAILALGAGLRLWDLRRNGFGTEYYSAGVRSMLDSLHNFFFNAFDPAGLVSLDKPPLAFWIQVASAKLFGFDELSVLLPQALEGIAAIALLHHLVARRFGAPAGLLAALFLAVTPISVAVDRSSNTESCLILMLLLAAWALVVATERASARLLALAMALVGVAFNVKMVAAFIALPGFALSYFVGAPIAWPRRIAHLALGGVVLAAVSLSWVAAYDLTPPDSRPYAGSTQRNSMIELAFQQYGVERLAGREPAPGAVEAPRPQGPNWYEARRVPPGALRLADPRLAGQVGWLMPLALAALLAWWTLPREAVRPALTLWGVWALAGAVVFSVANGVFHNYYVVILAPPLAALAAIGIVALWACRRRGAWLLPVALVLTGAWQAWLQLDSLGLPDEPGLGARLLALAERVPGDWRAWLLLGLIGGTLGAALALATARMSRGRATLDAVAVGVIALLATPTVWSLSTVVARTDVWFPYADLTLLTSDDPATSPRVRRTAASPGSRRLADFLAANHAGERYALATLTALQAAPLIILTGAPVIALGGYNGTDPIVTPEQLAQWVETGQLRFALLTTGGRGGGAAGAGRRRGIAPTYALAVWIRAHGTPLDPALWRAEDDAPPRPAQGRAANPMAWGDLFDLRPSAGAIRTAAD